MLEFEDYGPGVGRRFMQFALDLEDLLDRRVDLVFETVILDPDFLREVQATQEGLYLGPKGAEEAA